MIEQRLDTWYPDATEYYADADVPTIPVRQGDVLLPSQACHDSKGKKWLACLVIHPSCDIITQKVDRIQVCRVRLLSEQKDRFQEMIVAGHRTDSQGRHMVAMAHTFFLPPVPGSSEFFSAMYADFQRTTTIPIAEVTQQRRVAALTNDARVYFIRRSLYWRQRWFIRLQEVFDFEAARIGSDTDFRGPRPEWASLSVPS